MIPTGFNMRTLLSFNFICAYSIMHFWLIRNNSQGIPNLNECSQHSRKPHDVANSSHHVSYWTDEVKIYFYWKVHWSAESKYDPFYRLTTHWTDLFTENYSGANFIDKRTCSVIFLFRLRRNALYRKVFSQTEISCLEILEGTRHRVSNKRKMMIFTVIITITGNCRLNEVGRIRLLSKPDRIDSDDKYPRVIFKISLRKEE